LNIITFEPTPNPNAVKVIVDPSAPDAGGCHYSGDDADHPLARGLLAIAGVERVFVTPAFVTIVCSGPIWRDLKAEIALEIAEHRGSIAAMALPPRKTGEFHHGAIETQIADILDRQIRPLLARDGGDASLERFDPVDGTAWIRMEGACGGCPSGTMTLKRGIETAICKWVPEVRQVRQVNSKPRSREDAISRFKGWIERNWGRVESVGTASHSPFR